MKIKNATFLKSCGRPAEFPNFSYPEFAFMGRSNVGKSSLINMITGRNALVKTGSRPGLTQRINFFLINNNLSFVDLPGYGYAKAPKNVKKNFTPFIKSYIEKRKNLKLVFLLIDIRRDPDNSELELVDLMTRHSIPTAITLTKCDKLSKNKLLARLRVLMNSMDLTRESFLLSSSSTSMGKKEILSMIYEYSIQAPDDMS